MASIFSKIVDGEIPAHIVAETTEFLAFLDVSPLTMGHVLVIPKRKLTTSLIWRKKAMLDSPCLPRLWQQG